MKILVHKAPTRGYADHGWLKTHHTFSFAGYHDPDRVHFGALRVLNDDLIAPGSGFGRHPHRNMEIISIPLTGALKHADTMGNITVIREGEIQVMSAGTGIYHSEYNNSSKEDCAFLQIWIIPDKLNVQPRYDQMSLRGISPDGKILPLVGPSSFKSGLWIHQDAWISTLRSTSAVNETYNVKSMDHGVYIFLIKGKAVVEGKDMDERDGIGITQAKQFDITLAPESEVLFIEVPLDVSPE